MKTLKYIALSALFAGAIVGCSNQAPAPVTDSKSAGQAPQSATPAAYVNAKGELECPVTGDKIASAEKAAGYQDWNGKRYYFCCGMCPAKFKADPEKFAVRHEKEPM